MADVAWCADWMWMAIGTETVMERQELSGQRISSATTSLIREFLTGMELVRKRHGLNLNVLLDLPLFVYCCHINTYKQRKAMVIWDTRWTPCV
jgi:hypothetical protein